MPRPSLPRLYAILDIEILLTRKLSPRAVLEAWLAAGVRLVQLRAKNLTFGPMLEVADWMAARCSTVGAIFIVNDRADVARLSRASGLHVGQDDLSLEAARHILDPTQLIGQSTHSLEQLQTTLKAAPDYAAIGPVYTTKTKARPDPMVGVETVRAAAGLARSEGIPIVAIGGITLDTAPLVLEAGADAVAVVSDLLEGDLEERAAAFLRI